MALRSNVIDVAAAALAEKSVAIVPDFFDIYEKNFSYNDFSSLAKDCGVFVTHSTARPVVVASQSDDEASALIDEVYGVWFNRASPMERTELKK